jgi:hypothetical protein
MVNRSLPKSPPQFHPSGDAAANCEKSLGQMASARRAQAGKPREPAFAQILGK